MNVILSETGDTTSIHTVNPNNKDEHGRETYCGRTFSSAVITKERSDCSVCSAEGENITTEYEEPKEVFICKEAASEATFAELAKCRQHIRGNTLAFHAIARVCPNNRIGKVADPTSDVCVRFAVVACCPANCSVS